MAMHLQGLFLVKYLFSFMRWLLLFLLIDAQEHEARHKREREREGARQWEFALAWISASICLHFNMATLFLTVSGHVHSAIIMRKCEKVATENCQQCVSWKLATSSGRKFNNYAYFKFAVASYTQRPFLYVCVCVSLRFMHFIRIWVKQQATSATTTITKETRMQLFAYLANFQVKQIAKGTTK